MAFLNPSKVTTVIAGVALCPAFVFGQIPVGDSAPASMAPAAYQSAFDGYKPFVETEMKPWRRANEEIAKTDYMGGMSGMQSKDGAADGKLVGKPEKGAAKPPMAPMGAMPGPVAKPDKAAAVPKPTKSDSTQ